MVSDAVILGSEKLNLVLFVTDTPVTWRSHAGVGHTEMVCQQVESLYYTAEPVTVVTSDRVYTNMAITSIGISKSTEIGYAREIQASFQKIRVTSARTTTIPDSYGKSGATAAAAGTANTSAGKSGSSGSGSKTGSSGGKSSILYGAAKSMGLL